MAHNPAGIRKKIPLKFSDFRDLQVNFFQTRDGVKLVFEGGIGKAASRVLGRLRLLTQHHFL